MANPLDILNGNPAVMTKGMLYAFKDALIEVECVPGVVTLYDFLDYVGRNVGQGSGGGGETALIQYAPDQATDEITITVNGGLLPLSDDKILLLGPTGALEPGDEYGFTSDRVSTPNKLILNTVPIEPISFTIVLFVSA